MERRLKFVKKFVRNKLKQTFGEGEKKQLALIKK